MNNCNKLGTIVFNASNFYMYIVDYFNLYMKNIFLISFKDLFTYFIFSVVFINVEG